MLGIGEFLFAERSVGGRAWAPDLEGLSDVVTGLFEEEREGGIGAIPDGTAQNGASTGAPEVLSGQESAAAGSAGGCGDEGAAEEDSFTGDAIKIGGVNRIVHRSGSVDLRVRTCMPSPIIGEEEEEVGTRLGGEGWSRPCEEKCQRGDEGTEHCKTASGKQDE